VSITWYLCDLKTGALVTDLPLSVNGSIEKSIGESSSLGVTMAIHSDACPGNWATLVDPMRAMFILDDGVNPVQGYYVNDDTMGEPTASFTLTSLEGLLNEVYCRSHDFYTDDSTVIETLLSDVIVPSFGFELDITSTGKPEADWVDRSYAFEEDRTVGDAVGDLSKARGGPEWTIRLRWEDATRRRIIKTIVVGPKVGSTIESVVVENIHLNKRIRKGNYSRGNRATHVIATGDGSGEGRLMSAAHVDGEALDAGVPQWEVRIGTAGDLSDEQLEGIAFAGLLRRRNGVRTWEMELALSSGAPRPGRDFDAGDTITIDSEPTPDDPEEWRGPARVIGWRADMAGDDFRTVTPVFYEQPEENVT
jgi:hypothetical protein